jgi:hypothetical protein
MVQRGAKVTGHSMFDMLSLVLSDFYATHYMQRKPRTQLTAI